MKVCYFGTYIKDYPRNYVNIHGLKKNKVEVIECWAQKPEVEMHKKISVILFVLIFPISYFVRSILLLLKGIILYRKHKFRYIIVGFPGLLDIPIAYILRKLTKTKLIYDCVLSQYDAIVIDRKLINSRSLLSKFLLNVEKLLINCADHILAPTKPYMSFLSHNLSVKKNKISVLTLGALEQEELIKKNNKKLRLLYFGTYIPLHGVMLLLKAVKQLQNEGDSLEVVLIGNGQTFMECKVYADKYLYNARILDLSSEETIRTELLDADIVAGMFSTSEKGDRELQNNVLQAIATRKVCITANTSAIKEFFQHKKNIYLVEAGNVLSIKEGIKDLLENSHLRNSISEEGYKLFRKKFRPVFIGSELIKILEKV